MSRLVLAIPTWNNPAQLAEAVRTLLYKTDFQAAGGHLIVVDNGDIPVVATSVEVLRPGRNTGWMGGNNLALHGSESEFFCCCNDDVLFPEDRFFWRRMLSWFDRPETGGVGPISNYVSGWQKAQFMDLPPAHTTNLLIGFCAVYRRDLIGAGLDESLPGGDDLDISIRIRKQDKQLVVDRRCFLWHHGAQTGKRIHSDWDSREHQMRTVNAMIRKHGVRAWYDTIAGPYSELQIAEAA